MLSILLFAADGGIDPILIGGFITWLTSQAGGAYVFKKILEVKENENKELRAQKKDQDENDKLKDQKIAEQQRVQIEELRELIPLITKANEAFENSNRASRGVMDTLKQYSEGREDIVEAIDRNSQVLQENKEALAANTASFKILSERAGINPGHRGSGDGR